VRILGKHSDDFDIGIEGSIGRIDDAEWRLLAVDTEQRRTHIFSARNMRRDALPDS
jgi:hypothetical protein